MAVLTRRKIFVTRYEWSIPIETCGGELGKAWAAAAAEYRSLHNLPEDAVLSEDCLWVTSNGIDVTLYFTIEKAGDA